MLSKACNQTEPINFKRILQFPLFMSTILAQPNSFFSEEGPFISLIKQVSSSQVTSEEKSSRLPRATISIQTHVRPSSKFFFHGNPLHPEEQEHLWTTMGLQKKVPILQGATRLHEYEAHNGNNAYSRHR